MTTPPEQGKPATAAADTEASRIKSIDEKIAGVKDEILGAVKEMMGGAKAAEGGAQQAAQAHEAKRLDRPSQTADNLGDMVNAAVDKVLGDRKRADEDEQHRAQHAALEAARAEKPPVQRRRVHGVMGWGDPAE